MTEPILAEKVPGRGRMYRSPKTNELYPSVTNIIDVLAKPWLGGWMAKLVAGYAFDKRQAIMDLGDDREAAIDMLKGAPRRSRDAAAGVGDVIHAYVEALLTDGPAPAITEQHEPYLEGFLGFVEEFKPDFRTVEGTVFNHTERYSGTFDFLAVVEGLLVLGDWKTGKGIYDEVALQLAALRHADSLWDPIDGQLLPMPEVDACVAVHLQPGKAWLYPIDASHVAYEAFLGLRAAWPWTKATETAVGPRMNLARLVKAFEGSSSGAGGRVERAPAGQQERAAVPVEDSPAAASADRSDGLRDQGDGRGLAAPVPAGGSDG